MLINIKNVRNSFSYVPGFVKFQLISQLSGVLLFENTNILFKTRAFDIEIRDITFNLLLSIACTVQISKLNAPKS
jgi:hypothetical protein